jgi:hypothetical protein
MKKIISLGFFVLAFCSLFAQEKPDPITYGVKAGITFPQILGGKVYVPSAGFFDIEEQSITSFYVGGVVNIPIGVASFGGKMVLQPGLSFVGRGGQQVSMATKSTIDAAAAQGKDLTGSFTIKETISYLEIPLNIITYYKLGSGKLFFGTGLYVGFALGGTVKSDAEGGLMALFQPLGLLTTKDLTFGSGKDFKSIDCGMNYLLGYELKNGFGIHAGGGIGLVNTNGAFGDKAKTHNMSLYTGLQYSF